MWENYPQVNSLALHFSMQLFANSSGRKPFSLIADAGLRRSARCRVFDGLDVGNFPTY
jgi:hypothetical protein